MRRRLCQATTSIFTLSDETAETKDVQGDSRVENSSDPSVENEMNLQRSGQEAADVKSPSVASDDDVFSDSLREIARLSIAFNDLSQVKSSFIITFSGP